MTASMDVVPIPNLAYYLVVNVRWYICLFRQKGQGFAQQGWQESNPRPPGWSRLSVPLDYTPSSVCYSVVRLAQEYKRAAPFRKRLLNELDVVSPSYAVEGTSWGSVGDPIEGLGLQCLGHDAPARRQKAFEAL